MTNTDILFALCIALAVAGALILVVAGTILIAAAAADPGPCDCAYCVAGQRGDLRYWDEETDA